MYSSIKTHQGVMASGMFLNEITADSAPRITMCRKLFNNHFIMLIFIVVSFFSHMAYSADPIVCQPTGFVNRIYINANITITPQGYGAGITYTGSTPAAQAGPITCPTGTPDNYSIFSAGPSGAQYPSSDASADLSQGFVVLLGVGYVPGMSAGSGTTILNGSSAKIPKNIYPSFTFYPDGKPGDAHDLDLHNYFIGYIGTEGVVPNNVQVPSDKTGLTGVYLSGHIHIPPYCTYMADQSVITVPMGTYFASDFAAAGVGGKVGPMQRIAGNGECTGGSSHGDGDLVHISVGSLTPGDGNDTLGVVDQPDIGIQVFDDQGNKLQVNGPYSGSAYTTKTLKGEDYVGAFNFPLNFQLVSRTGKAPSNTGTFIGYVTINLSMD